MTSFCPIFLPVFIDTGNWWLPSGIMILFSVFAFAYAGIWFPAVIAGAYAFLTIQVEDTTIMDFIRYACAYFLTTQQYFEWRYTSDE